MMSAHDVVAEYWAAAEARDWDRFGALLADDVLYRGPQARELVRALQSGDSGSRGPTAFRDHRDQAGRGGLACGPCDRGVVTAW